MRYTLSLFVVFISLLPLPAQQVLFRKKIGLRKDFAAKREALPMFNETSGEKAFIIFDDTEISAVRIDRDTVRTQLTTPRPSGKRFQSVLGYASEGLRYHIYFSNGARNLIGVVTFDFNTGTVISNASTGDFKKEKCVASLSHKGKFYFLTVLKNTSTVKVYTFTNATEVSTGVYEFAGTKFLEDPNAKLSDVVAVSGPVLNDNTVSNSVDLSLAPGKLFAFDDQFVLTFDHLKDRTVVLTINYAESSSRKDVFSQPKLKSTPSTYGRANSFIHDGHLYQLRVALSEMVVGIVKIPQGETVATFSVTEEEPIAFRNTPILQDGGRTVFSSEMRVLEKTKQFLRRASRGACGISVYSGNSGLEVTLGSCIVSTAPAGGTGGMAPVMLSTPSGAIQNSVFNPVYSSYAQYTGSMSVYFKTLLENKTFKHIEGQIPDNPIDAIKKFVGHQTDKKELPAQTVFKTGSLYVLGYHDPKTDEYILRGFR